MGLLVGAGPCLAGPAEEAAGWRPQTADEEQGIEVYLRERADRLPEFLAITRVSARLSTLVAVLRDPQAMPRWVYRTRSVQVLEAPDATRGLSRVITGMPWPLQDRESIVEWQLKQDAASGEVLLEGRSAPDRAPPLPGVVRMPNFASSWVFKPLGGGQVEVRFSGFGNLGGNLAEGTLRAFVDAAVWVAPLETVRGLREMIQKPEYRNAVLPHIREPQ
jgi:START domain